MSTPNKQGGKGFSSPGGRALFTPCKRIGLSRNYKSPLLSPRVTQIEDIPASSTSIIDSCLESSSPILSQNKRMGLSRSYKKLVKSPAAAATKQKINERLSESSTDSNPHLTPCKGLGLSKVSGSPIVDNTKNINITEVREDSIIYNDLLSVCKTPPNKQLGLVSCDQIPKKKIQFDTDELVPATTDQTLKSKEYKVCPSPSGSKIILMKKSKLSLKRNNIDTIESQEIENLRCDVEQLEGTVIDREETLSKLQQCAVYEQSQDLSTLTATWKNGCELALRRIITNYKGTSNINMDSLLMRLNVPKDILQYHSETDEFTWTLI